jgi:signal transduction histidine kinase
LKLRLTVLILFLTFGEGAFCQLNLDSLFSIWEDNSKSDSIRVDAYHNYIDKQYVNKYPDSAITMADDLINFANEHKYPFAIAVAHHIKGNSFLSKKDLYQALERYKLSVEIYEEKGNRYDAAPLLKRMGHIYSDLGNYPKALYYFQRSISIYEEIGKDVEIAKMLNSIGAIYGYIGNHEKSLEVFKRCLSINEEYGYQIGIGRSLINLGSSYNNMHNYEKAMEYWQRSLEVFEKGKFKFGIAFSKKNLAILYEKQGQYEKAMEYLKSGLEIFDGLDETHRMAEIRVQIGKFHYNRKNYLEAISLCEQALSLSERIGIVRIQMNSCECLYQAHKEMGNTNTALTFHETFLTLNDSLKSEETTLELQKMEFNNQLMEDSIFQDARDKEIKRAHEDEMRKKNRLKNIAIASAILILILFWGLYGRWKKALAEKSLTNEKMDKVLQFEHLRKIDAVIEGQDKERNRILEDLHDNLAGKFNALHFTWSSIYEKEIESGFETDKEIKALDDIIQSVSTEIRDFIKNNARSKVGEFGLEDSLEELKLLVQSSHKMEVNTIVNGVDLLNIKVALELYKVILELVSNALKYSEAAYINIQLNRINQHIVLIFEDNGIGFDILSVKNGMGLKNIRSRVERLGGIVEFDSKISRGTTVIIELDA